MKANKFVEKFGWDAAKEALTLACDKLEHVNYENYAVLISDLKRLVESHELVEKWRGLEASKIKVGLLRTFGFETQADQLQEAVDDVESCQ